MIKVLHQTILDASERILTIDEKTRNKKLQYNINRETAKTSALSSGEIHQHEYLSGEEILPFDQSRVLEQALEIY